MPPAVYDRGNPGRFPLWQIRDQIVANDLEPQRSDSEIRPTVSMTWKARDHVECFEEFVKQAIPQPAD